MKTKVICSVLICVSVLTIASCSRRNKVDNAVNDDDILAPLPAPVSQTNVPAIPVADTGLPPSVPVGVPQQVVRAPVPAPINQTVISQPGLAPLPAPSGNCDVVPTSKSGLVQFRRNCL